METPPRAWGRRVPGWLSAPVGRNTPTCVGKTQIGGGGQFFFGKHPHVRGEDLSKLFLSLFKIETPPRAWGRPILLSDAAGKIRNTPTCVGKTPPTVQEKYFLKKHPHVRGEDPSYFPTPQARSETPPRAWGRPYSATWDKQYSRNTPTCVGKTCPLPENADLDEKHPHVRGEDPL